MAEKRGAEIDAGLHFLADVLDDSLDLGFFGLGGNAIEGVAEGDAGVDHDRELGCDEDEVFARHAQSARAHRAGIGGWIRGADGCRIFSFGADHLSGAFDGFGHEGAVDG
jgi:hypothetical protein